MAPLHFNGYPFPNLLDQKIDFLFMGTVVGNIPFKRLEMRSLIKRQS
jgi:hypothetical protein